MLAPDSFTILFLISGELSGIIMCAFIPNFFAINETAPAWFPDEFVVTPFFFSSSDKFKIEVIAPRALNAPPT